MSNFIVYQCLCFFNTAFTWIAWHGKWDTRQKKQNYTVNSLITWIRNCIRLPCALRQKVASPLSHCIAYGLIYTFNSIQICKRILSLLMRNDFREKEQLGNYHLQWSWNTRIHWIFFLVHFFGHFIMFVVHDVHTLFGCGYGQSSSTQTHIRIQQKINCTFVSFSSVSTLLSC